VMIEMDIFLHIFRNVYLQNKIFSYLERNGYNLYKNGIIYHEIEDLQLIDLINTDNIFLIKEKLKKYKDILVVNNSNSNNSNNKSSTYYQDWLDLPFDYIFPSRKLKMLKESDEILFMELLCDLMDVGVFPSMKGRVGKLDEFVSRHIDVTRELYDLIQDGHSRQTIDCRGVIGFNYPINKVVDLGLRKQLLIEKKVDMVYNDLIDNDFFFENKDLFRQLPTWSYLTFTEMLLENGLQKGNAGVLFMWVLSVSPFNYDVYLSMFPNKERYTKYDELFGVKVVTNPRECFFKNVRYWFRVPEVTAYILKNYGHGFRSFVYMSCRYIHVDSLEIAQMLIEFLAKDSELYYNRYLLRVHSKSSQMELYKLFWSHNITIVTGLARLTQDELTEFLSLIVSADLDASGQEKKFVQEQFSHICQEKGLVNDINVDLVLTVAKNYVHIAALLNIFISKAIMFHREEFIMYFSGMINYHSLWDGGYDIFANLYETKQIELLKHILSSICDKLADPKRLFQRLCCLFIKNRDVGMVKWLYLLRPDCGDKVYLLIIAYSSLSTANTPVKKENALQVIEFFKSLVGGLDPDTITNPLLVFQDPNYCPLSAVERKKKLLTQILREGTLQAAKLFIKHTTAQEFSEINIELVLLQYFESFGAPLLKVPLYLIHVFQSDITPSFLVQLSTIAYKSDNQMLLNILLNRTKIRLLPQYPQDTIIQRIHVNLHQVNQINPLDKKNTLLRDIGFGEIASIDFNKLENNIIFDVDFNDMTWFSPTNQDINRSASPFSRYNEDFKPPSSIRIKLLPNNLNSI